MRHLKGVQGRELSTSIQSPRGYVSDFPTSSFGIQSWRSPGLCAILIKKCPPERQSRQDRYRRTFFFHSLFFGTRRTELRHRTNPLRQSFLFERESKPVETRIRQLSKAIGHSQYKKNGRIRSSGNACIAVFYFAERFSVDHRPVGHDHSRDATAKSSVTDVATELTECGPHRYGQSAPRFPSHNGLNNTHYSL